MRGDAIHGNHWEHKGDHQADYVEHNAEAPINHTDTAGEKPENIGNNAYEQALQRFFHGSHSSIAAKSKQGMNFTEFVRKSDVAGHMAEEVAGLLAT